MIWNIIIKQISIEWKRIRAVFEKRLTTAFDVNGLNFLFPSCSLNNCRNISKILSNWLVRAHATSLMWRIVTYVVSPSKMLKANSGWFWFKANPATNVRLFRNWTGFPISVILLHSSNAFSSASGVFCSSHSKIETHQFVCVEQSFESTYQPIIRS